MIGTGYHTLNCEFITKTISGVLAHERTLTCYHVTMESICLHSPVLVSLLSHTSWFKIGLMLSFSFLGRVWDVTVGCVFTWVV